MIRIPVEDARTPYEVAIAPGAADLLSALLESRAPGAHRIALVHPEVVTGLAHRILRALRRDGFEALAVPVPTAEAAKTVAVAADCWSALGRAGFTRTDVVVGLGGGASTDLAGFVAATWLRGVSWVSMPTTLLAMVDAAVGGKTGINTAEGKNLVGAFHPPIGVLADLDTLQTVPAADHAAGLAEVVKAGFIADPVILDLIESDPPGAAAGGRHSAELIERAVRVKARVVAADPTEAGPREILNYGHTLGHAIECVEDYAWRHGDAVSVGLVYAAELGRALGRLDSATADRHASILGALGLPLTYRHDRWPEILAAMRVDKKNRADRLRFVVLDGLARPVVLEDADPALLAAVYDAVAA